MKRLIRTLSAFCLCAVALCSTASAQQSLFPQREALGVEGYALPLTVVEVSVVQEREVIIRGPYARYASQYLGVTGAPMVDKESYKILSATLSYSTEADLSQVYALDSKTAVKNFEWITPESPQIQKQKDAPRTDADFQGAQLSGRTPFKDVGTSTVVENNSSLPIQRASAVEKSEEQMAADAAEMIFKIRKRRVELICGDQGEHVFGAGLEAALKEMERIENEYVSLFLGKRYTQVTKKVFEVTPEKGATRVVAFRFTTFGGVVAADDLSSNPVNLEFTSLKAVATQQAVDSKSKIKTVKYRIPQLKSVKLWDGTTTFDTKDIPMYQDGKVIDVPVL
ncbi:MAG: DUF4831 family protein [Rikenellaceae bacterium]